MRASPCASTATRVVVIDPQCRLLNLTRVNIHYRLRGTCPRGSADASTRPRGTSDASTWHVSGRLGADDRSAVALHGMRGGCEERAVQLAFGGGDDKLMWSGAVAVSEPADTVIAVPAPSVGLAAAAMGSDAAADGAAAGGGRMLVRVTVEVHGASLLVTFGPCRVAPYRIENACAMPIALEQAQQHHRHHTKTGVPPPSSPARPPQEGCTAAHVVAAHGELEYAWDEPTGTHALLLSPRVTGAVHRFHVSLDHLGEPTPHGTPTLLWTSVLLGEASRILRITPRMPDHEAASAALNMSLSIAIGSIGVSVVDTSRRQELTHACSLLVVSPASVHPFMPVIIGRAVDHHACDH